MKYSGYLFFSAIDSDARFFLNGRPIGSHSGWNTPAVIAVKTPGRPPTGKQMLAVKVWTPTGLAGLYGPAALVIEHGAKGPAAAHLTGTVTVGD